MNENARIAELEKEIQKTEAVAAKLHDYYLEFKAKEQPMLGKSRGAGMILAGIFCDYYTAVETCFFRISRFFENHLSKERWHKELLHKMTLSISDTREAVISDSTFAALEELLRFRHFRRYYFDLEYDWDKLGFLEIKYLQSRDLLNGDLGRFKNFLNNLRRE